ncbi:hypothetical protein [uncultured Bacteroides sp.]|uniref:hypothetical protein n=1 Tax=uncultured Bacteroides sp. TaxID=162156 RepID=UPI0025D92D90|nr:hypothetical protein [uncultured Bacteroides sp.]
MEYNEIIQTLKKREGYNEKRAALAASESQHLSKELVPLLNDWLYDANKMQDITVQGISLLHIKKHKCMNYLAALLTMDWLIKEPEIAKPIVEGFLII